MKRREFIAGVGSTAAWPMTARAQQTATPVIGLLSALSRDGTTQLMAAFRDGLSEAGYVDGRSITISYSFADGHYETLPPLAAQLVRNGVSLIVAFGPPAALAAKAATGTIPIVFVVGFDPVAAGLVTSLSRPESNSTGIALFSAQLGQKRFELVRELLPNASNFAMLVNPHSPEAPFEIRDDRAAAEAMGTRLTMMTASTANEIKSAFVALDKQHPDALLISSDPLFMDQREKVVGLVAERPIPTIYPFHEFASLGGLLSYGPKIRSAYYRAGTYVGRLLKGAKPGDLSVEQPTEFELVVNLQTAKTLGLKIPATLLARADEVIE